MPLPPAAESVTDEPARSTPAAMVVRLAAMMFAQYWSLGAWWVTVGSFIAANTGDEGERLFTAGFVGYSVSAAALGSLVAPVVAGWLADRFFSAERLLAVFHFAAAATLWWMQSSGSQSLFFAAMVVYFQMYGPTTTLTNTIALSHLADGDREYPVVRLFGTIGWVVAGVFIGVVCAWLAGGVSIEPTRTPILIAAVSHAATALYSATLPRTRPRAPAITRLAERPRLLRNSALMSFLGVSALLAFTTQNYLLMNVFLNRSGYAGAAATMTLGQMTEVVCLGGMAVLMRRFGLKRLFLIGVAGWGLRYVFLAIGSQGGPGSLVAPFVIAAIALHGPAYVFTYLTGQLYVDRLTGPGSRGVVQGMHTIATNGLGHLLGSVLAGWSQARYLTPVGVSPPPYDWMSFWLIPIGPCLLAGGLFWWLFSEWKEPAAASDERE